MNKTLIGKQGEDLACDYLKKQGYKIIERNFRIRGGEIDIVAIDDNTLVYIEVKTRTSHQFGLPEESITFYKLKFLERAAKFWRSKNRHSNLPSLERIDVVSIDMNKASNPQVKLIKNVSQ